MDGSVSVITNPSVNVRLTTTISSFEVKRRFDRGISIAELKGKLEMVVGAPASSMDLELFSTSDTLLQKLDNDNALLGSYPVDDDCRIHVIDRSGGQLGEFTDVTKVEKYVMADEDYEKLTDSARSFMKKQSFGRYNEEDMARKKAESIAREEEHRVAAEAISVGSRCQVRVPGQPVKVGTVMFVGTTDFKSGYWVGVKYDEPLGKNDGSCEGKRYFECGKNYGAFVRPLSVTVGDFPEEDYGLDEM
ncbi:tubulin-folding cofactor B [Corythoichthys intestinalis]|uniref:tubulin-folding cofactor B n=1 Tax=Corythoichthys intestinalis TaxID=161448 RepID=UPI0025A5A0D4|nr:tubulin-folding cofactor B [Corythoichthys intestinalis]XP_061797820.1 tubulin-folding cofactor B-like [Nerophis lumbriciformis]